MKRGGAFMLFDKTIAVVVPAYNEEKQIRQVLETMPGFVDRIIVVNDCSTDNTAAIVFGLYQQAKISSIIIKNNFIGPHDGKYTVLNICSMKNNKRIWKHFIPRK